MPGKGQESGAGEPSAQNASTEVETHADMVKPARGEGESGAAKTLVVMMVGGVAVLLLLMALRADVRAEPTLHSIFFVGILALFAASSVCLDIYLFERKRTQSPQDAKTNKPAYHPNLRIWGVGLLTGIGATLLYLVGDAALSLVKANPITYETIYLYALLLSILTIMMGFTVWGIVRVCQSD